VPFLSRRTTLGHRLIKRDHIRTCQARPQGVAVIAAVGQENLTLAETFEHVGGASSVMSLPGRQLQENGQAVGVDQGMDFRRQSASRTAPYSGLQ
jgi:hypothetical protein